MMETPICDFVKAYREKAPTRLHMPGHKGQPLLGCEGADITEFDGADVLYHAQGIIAQSEANAAGLFGAAKTVYSTEGASLAIRGLVFLLKQYALQKGEQPLILAGRNAHKTFVTAAALLGVAVEWLFSEPFESVVCCPITPRGLDARLAAMPQKPTAVYITSPDYLGNLADVAGLAKVCERHGVLLCVDNAHGAYLKFLTPSLHPLDLGAHLCCDSAHKTLPALTGGAYLHLAHTAPDFFCRQAAEAMALFASTSPSYLILQSLDEVNRYLADGYKEALADFVPFVSELKQQLTHAGYQIVGDEPLKITLAPKEYGYTGDQLAEILLTQNMVCEFHDPDHLVMMVTPQSGADVLERIVKVLTALPKKPAISQRAPALTPLRKAMPLQAALFAPFEELPLEACEGRVLASPTVACPPAVPVAVCGEELDASALALMGYYGHTTCHVVAQD